VVRGCLSIGPPAGNTTGMLQQPDLASQLSAWWSGLVGALGSWFVSPA
jgi:hypothetical protein